MADGKLIFDTKLDSSGLVSGLKSVGGVAKMAASAAATAFNVSAKAITAVSGALSALGASAIKSFAE